MEVIKLLLAEDDEAFRTVTRICLEMTGEYEIYEAKDGLEGYNLFKSHVLDIIVADIDMPKITGFAMIDLIRKEDKYIPILVTTGLTESKHVREGFKLNIDNYIKKPFLPEELDEYIKSALRHKINPGPVSERKQFQMGDYVFDYDGFCLKYKDNKEHILLSGRETEILYMLYQNRGKIVKYNEILKKFWGSENDSYHKNSLNVFICNLRKYLKDDPSVQIFTFRREGVKLVF